MQLTFRCRRLLLSDAHHRINQSATDHYRVGHSGHGARTIGILDAESDGDGKRRLAPDKRHISRHFRRIKLP
jgi:hypothetical protein